MSERATSVTPAVFALLLALLKGETHGYALMVEVEKLTAGMVTLGPATLYRSLQRMRVDGLVEEIATKTITRDDLPADRRAERRRSYRITSAGRRAADRETRRLSQLLSAARSLGLPAAMPDEE